MTNSRVLMAQHGTQATIKVEGRGTFENAAAFKQTYGQLLGKGAKEFLIDLSSCEMLDSTFLGILVGCGLRVKQDAGHVHIVEANREILHLLDEVGLDRILDYKQS